VAAATKDRSDSRLRHEAKAVIATPRRHLEYQLSTDHARADLFELLFSESEGAIFGAAQSPNCQFYQSLPVRARFHTALHCILHMQLVVWRPAIVPAEERRLFNGQRKNAADIVSIQ